MKKDRKTVLSAYVRNLAEDEVKYLGTRLVERLSNDLAEALDLVSNNKHVDEVFRDASSANELYNTIDLLKESVLRECRKRNIAPARGKMPSAA